MLMTLGEFFGWSVFLATAPIALIGLIGWPIHLINEHFRHQALHRRDEIRRFNREMEEMELYNEIHYG